MMLESGRTIPDTVLGLPVSGRNLRGRRFGDQIEGETLLVFLRHLG